MSKKEKIAWILPGGGSRASYTAGAVCAVAHYKAIRPSLIIAGSGGAGTACYYLTGQIKLIEDTWCNHLATKKFANPLRFWKLMDVEYLVDEVFRRQNPLDLKALNESSIKLLVGVTNTKTGEINYINVNKSNVWNVLKATKSSPVFSGLKQKEYDINGTFCSDSRCSTRWEQAIKIAIKEGANKIIIFDNYHPKSSFISGRFLYSLYLHSKNADYKKRHRQYLLEEKEISIPKNVKLLHLRPKERLEIAPWSNNKEKLTQTFKRGGNDAKEFFCNRAS